MTRDFGSADRRPPLERLHESLNSGDTQNVRSIVTELNPAAIADLLESLPLSQRVLVWRNVVPENLGDVLVELNEEVAASLIAVMEPGELVTAAAGLEIDDLADLMPDLPEAVRRDIEQTLDHGDREMLRAVMRYPEDCAGGLMNP